MPDTRPEKPEWFNEFQKANADASYPLTPPSRPGVEGRPSDRRQHSRFQVDDAPAEILRKGILIFGSRRTKAGREALDLSEGGVRLLAAERVAPGTRIVVKISIQKFQDEIECEAEVRWCRRKTEANDPGFLMGLRFTDDDADRMRRIGVMRGYFTSPQFMAAREKRLREKGTSFYLKG